MSRDPNVTKERALALMTQYSLYLGNVDIKESLRSVEDYCNAALAAYTAAGSDAGTSGTSPSSEAASEDGDTLPTEGAGVGKVTRVIRNRHTYLG